ncbi:squalene--hopene cyclase [Kaustia mangrovi]|uniref:Squalene--hopene cyclase n=1 Tax=Kaustia mangrovi TaxID=2593653 RepID=A0A7S8HD86_9HYPH|nr:squalene--hopene cyclase [Kaustia mangrovi]QPC44416.1 squalene--hopene cyclase [Kaustia mangrovi]
MVSIAETFRGAFGGRRKRATAGETPAQPAPAVETTSRPKSLLDEVEATVEETSRALAGRQKDDGHIVYELEADATIPAEYIFLNHFLGEPEPELEAELGEYLRSIQSDRHGGWPLFHDGDFNISASVKAYYALKIVGDDPDAPHMKRAREAILAHGGAETSNVFTRYALALFGEVPWRAVPVMPAELMLMPRWFPVNMWRFSYWSRTVIAPLLILAALKPRAKNPTGAHCQEIFRTPPEKIRKWLTNPTGSRWGSFFLALDKVLQPTEKHVFPRLPTRAKSIQAALDFIKPRLNGEDGLGAIFPAMANSVMAFTALGYPKDDPDLVTARQSIRNLLVAAREERDGEPRYCQPCVSPVWDTALAAHALSESGEDSTPSVKAACDWLVDRQITDVKGDWAINAPDLEPGGWAFQYNNDHYPDVDDTAVVGMLLHRTDPEGYKDRIERAARWIEGMQSSNGGWGAFDIDNNADFLNSIPFADHGALLDPPTSDVAARCLSFLAQIGYSRTHPTVARGVHFLKTEQEEDGSWFGRWGTNYIYGTWSVLCALNAVGEDMSAPYVRKAVDWLHSRQREDGGWGEDGATYWQERRDETKASTPSQTAWAVLALMAAGEVDSEPVERGIRYLLSQPRKNEKWEEPWFTAVGFPRVFYLRYHGYSAFFPVWALSRYRNLKRGNSREVAWGM